MRFQYLLALPLFLLLASSKAKGQSGSPLLTIQNHLADSSVVPYTGKAMCVAIYCGPPKFRPNNPLFVIDGELVGEGIEFVKGNINPSDIEKVKVIKGPEAAVIFGSRAANGVIIITTKKRSGTKKKIFHSEQIKKASLE
jgi:TonB-dependent SusC/RagA subfamily outer membrane receptor